MRRDGHSHRYPDHWGVPTVAAEEWISVSDAADRLGMSRLRVAHLGTKEDLVQAADPRGRAGFTVESVETFAAWRAEAPLVRRVVRGVLGWLRFL